MLEHRGYWLAGVASGAAVFLALLPAAFPGPAAYNPQLAVLTATLVAVIWYTAFTFRLVDFAAKERDLARASVATCLLSELSDLDSTLRRVAEGPYLIKHHELPTPILAHSLSRMHLFKPETAHLLSECMGTLEGIKIRVLRLQEVERLDSPVANNLRDSIRALVRFPIAGMPLLVEKLREEGGVMPDGADFRSVDTETLPASVFTSGAGSD